VICFARWSCGFDLTLLLTLYHLLVRLLPPFHSLFSRSIHKIPKGKVVVASVTARNPLVGLIWRSGQYDAGVQARPAGALSGGSNDGIGEACA
jgi:hypothetical protein